MSKPVEYIVGGFWGDSIRWSHPEQFVAPDLDESTRFDVVGWKPRIPQVGDLLRGSFETSWMQFRFVEVRRCGDPQDMFFAVVTCIRQESHDGKRKWEAPKE